MWSTISLLFCHCMYCCFRRKRSGLRQHALLFPEKTVGFKFMNLQKNINLEVHEFEKTSWILKKKGLWIWKRFIDFEKPDWKLRKTSLKAFQNQGWTAPRDLLMDRPIEHRWRKRVCAGFGNTVNGDYLKNIIILKISENVCPNLKILEVWPVGLTKAEKALLGLA